MIKISVITATFNNIETIEATINSVNSQEWGLIEHIFIDGGSTDGTLEKIHELKSKNSLVISEPDNGIYDALNKGIARSTGDVIGFLHADDFYASAKSLSLVAQVFDDPKIAGVYGDLDYVSSVDPTAIVRRWRTGEFNSKKLKNGWMPPHPSLHIKREWYTRIGLFDTSFRISADYYSILQLFSDAGFQSRYISEVLIKMRLGGTSNRSIANIITKSKEDYIALRKTGIGGSWTILCKNLRKIRQFF